jgi:hypothetical protein
MNLLNWLTTPLGRGLDFVQTHPTGSFQIAVVVLLLIISLRLGRIAYLLKKQERRQSWRNYGFVTGHTLFSSNLASAKNFVPRRPQGETFNQMRLRNIKSGFIPLKDATPDELAKLTPYERAYLGDYSQMQANGPGRTDLGGRHFD